MRNRGLSPVFPCTLLNAIQANDEVYSAAFSLSVNNAIAGLYSIVYTNQREITVIAPAFIVVPGILLEDAVAASSVLYDEPIADFYPAFQFNLNVDKTCALALKIALTGDSFPLQFSRSSMTRDDGKYPIQLFAFLKFLLAENRMLRLGNRGHS